MISSYCSLNTIPYCLTYEASTSTTCAQCIEGYRLNRDTNKAKVTPNTCTAIAAAENCVNWDETNNICKKCSTGYLLYTDTASPPTWNNCVLAWAYTTSNCNTKNTVTSVSVNPFIFPHGTTVTQVTQAEQPCLKCAAGYLPI